MAHPGTFASRTVSRNSRATDISNRGRTFPRPSNRRSTTFGPFGPSRGGGQSSFDPTSLIEPGINLLAQLFGGRGDPGAGGRAAEAEVGGNQQAIDALIKQLGISRLDADPFITAGQQALPGQVEGSTVEGLDAQLARLADTDIFGTLLGERQRASEGQLAARGDRFSGEGARAAAEVPTDLLLQLNELLNRRGNTLVAGGQNAALGFGNLAGSSTANIGNLFSRSGVSAGAGILTDAQARASQSQQNLNAFAAFGKAFFGGTA